MEEKIRADDMFSEKSSKNISREKSRSKKIRTSKLKKSSEASGKSVKLKKKQPRLSLLDKNEELPK